MGGTRTMFVVGVPQKRLIFGASIQPRNRDLHLVAGLKLCLMSKLAVFRRNTGHRAKFAVRENDFSPNDQHQGHLFTSARRREYLLK
jgi:hypothetical protein